MKKIKTLIRLKPLFGLLVTSLLLIQFYSCDSGKTNSALIITGQNTTNWETSSLILETILDQSGVFKVTTITSPAKGEDMSKFLPQFGKYDVVVLDYNGDPWPDQAKKEFVEYVKNGGGVVVYHAANNSFPGWIEYNEIIGLGGWGNRDESSGDYVYWKDDDFIVDSSPGKAGDFGEQHAFLVINRDTYHPITKGLNERWMHDKDKLFGLLRGPASGVNVLATAFSDTSKGGTNRHEPVLFTVEYGAGRIFHTVLGNCMDDSEIPAMECAGFITTLQRGTEWAATGSVTLDIPDNLPNSASIVKWPDFRPLLLEELLDKVTNYKVGQSRKYLADLTERIRQSEGSPELLLEFEKELLKLLNSDATIDCKRYICNELSWMGSEESIPILEKLAEEEATAEMAAFTLERLNAEF